MMPGKGTRMSPLTQCLYGIKPLMPMMVRHSESSPWLSGATASLYSWNLVAYHLQRMGFEGIAWKWGDEPQIPAQVLQDLQLDLSQVDAIRFGAQSLVTEDLAQNKEWLFCDDQGRLIKQVRRRSRDDLVRIFDKDPADEVSALIHIGSPALSQHFLQAALELFGDLPGAIDIDGYLFEAFTHNEKEWQRELQRDAGLQQLLSEFPDFYQRAQQLKSRVEALSGHPFAVQVIDFGAGLYWGDVGQLSKARQAFTSLLGDGPEAQFARRLAAIDAITPDHWGNRSQQATYPQDGSVKNCLIINSHLGEGSCAADSVFVDSVCGKATVEAGSVVVQSTLESFDAGPSAFAFRLLGETQQAAADEVLTSIPKDPRAPAAGLEVWRAPASVNTGDAAHYKQPVFDNPMSFAEKFEQMRQRERSIAEIQDTIESQFRGPLLEKICPKSQQD